jgi:hypothetical protein
VYATVPAGRADVTSRGAISACTPAASIAASAALGESPLTSGTGSRAPRTTVGSAAANGSAGRPANARRIVAAQIMAGRSPPKTCGQKRPSSRTSLSPGTSPRGSPTHTADASCGVKPSNHAAP